MWQGFYCIQKSYEISIVIWQENLWISNQAFLDDKLLLDKQWPSYSSWVKVWSGLLDHIGWWLPAKVQCCIQFLITEYLKVDAILKTLVQLRSSTEREHTKLLYKSYIIHLQVRFSPILHVKFDAYKAMLMTSNANVVSCGSSSYTMRQLLTSPIGDIIVACYVKYVNLNQDLHPHPLPQGFRDQHFKTIREDFMLPKLDVPRKDPKSFSLQIYVTYSDIDLRNHTNHIAYVRFCLECGRMAVYKGKFTRLTKDLPAYPMLDLDTVFIQESLAGDCLVVETWEDNQSLDTLHFHIYKEEKLIFYAKIRFQLCPSSQL